MDTFDYAPLGDGGFTMPTATIHECSADCYSFAERASDPTIDAHFNATGPHRCEIGCDR